MSEFTVIYFDYGVYSNNKIKVKKIMSDNGLKWNFKKNLDLGPEEVLNNFEIFGRLDKISDDKLLNGRKGSQGVWESEENAIKAVMIEKKSEDEHLPVLMIFKGNETGEFYKKFIGYCIGLGCTIAKVVEEEGKFLKIFEKRVNIELVSRLDSVEGSKSVMKEMFLNRIDELSGIGYKFSSSFIEGWKECISKYGFYTTKELYDEIEKNNELRRGSVDKVDNVDKKIEKNNVTDNKNIVDNFYVIKSGKFVFKRKIVGS